MASAILAIVASEDNIVASDCVAAIGDGDLDDGRRRRELPTRIGDGAGDRLPPLAKELVAANADVIVSPTPPAVRAAKNSMTTIPIVMFNVADSVDSGLVSDLARPPGLGPTKTSQAAIEP